MKYSKPHVVPPLFLGFCLTLFGCGQRAPKTNTQAFDSASPPLPAAILAQDRVPNSSSASYLLEHSNRVLAKKAPDAPARDDAADAFATHLHALVAGAAAPVVARAQTAGFVPLRTGSDIAGMRSYFRTIAQMGQRPEGYAHLGEREWEQVIDRAEYSEILDFYARMRPRVVAIGWDEIRVLHLAPGEQWPQGSRPDFELATALGLEANQDHIAGGPVFYTAREFLPRDRSPIDRHRMLVLAPVRSEHGHRAILHFLYALTDDGVWSPISTGSISPPLQEPKPGVPDRLVIGG